MVKVEHGDESGLFRARNISDVGMMLDAPVMFEVGERVSINLAEHLMIRGAIAWRDEHRCGVEFEQPIDCSASLRSGAERRREDRRHGLRLSAAKRATTYAENGVRAVRVLNVSHAGMCLGHDGSLSGGMLLRVIVENGIEREGRVRWSSDGRAGLRLLEPLSCEELARVAGLDHHLESAAERIAEPT